MRRRQGLTIAAATMALVVAMQPAHAADIDGTDNDDVLEGTEDADVINGFAGNDTITALGGNDVVDGGLDDDTVDLGAGDDIYILSGGNDTVEGGDGTDLLDGSATTILDVDLSTGTYTTPEGNGQANNFENVNGGPGNDVLVGTSGPNVINGNAGDDTIDAGEGDDTVTAGDGNDRIDGGSGTDNLLGGAGIDILDFSQTSATQPVDFDLDDATVIDGFGFTDTIAGFESVVGTDLDDTIFGTSGDNVLDGGFGDDFLCGDGGNDTLIGNYGNDLACPYDDAATIPATIASTIDVAANDDQIADDDTAYDGDDPVIPIVYALVDDGGIGATIDPATGVITVAAELEGTYTLVYSVSRGALTDDASVVVTVTEPPPPTTDGTTPTTDPGPTPTTDPGPTPTTDAADAVRPAGGAAIPATGAPDSLGTQMLVGSIAVLLGAVLIAVASSCVTRLRRSAIRRLAMSQRRAP